MLTADECSNYEAKRLHLDNLFRMVSYCENKTDCRRAQLLQYFSEIFDKQHCRKMPLAVCDNCASTVRACAGDASRVSLSARLLFFEIESYCFS